MHTSLNADAIATQNTHTNIYFFMITTGMTVYQLNFLLKGILLPGHVVSVFNIMQPCFRRPKF